MKNAEEESEIQEEEPEGRSIPEGHSPCKKSGTETLSGLNHAEVNKVRRGLRVSKWFPESKNKETKNAIAKQRLTY